MDSRFALEFDGKFIVMEICIDRQTDSSRMLVSIIDDPELRLFVRFAYVRVMSQNQK